MIGDRFGLVVADEADFVDAATTQITSWLAQPEIFRTISERIVQEVGDKTVQGAAQRQALIGMVIQAAENAGRDAIWPPSRWHEDHHLPADQFGLAFRAQQIVESRSL